MPKAASMRVEVKPALLRWARDRAGLDTETLAHRFPRFEDWERESARPTLKQLEQFANATHTPIGFFFLPEPPVERVPIPDFRTAGNQRLEHPSPDLLDTVYLCQQRQEKPSGAARATRPVPMVPPAPLGFSMITDCLSGPLIRSARMRAIASVGPPAGKGTTIVIGSDG